MLPKRLNPKVKQAWYNRCLPPLLTLLGIALVWGIILWFVKTWVWKF